MESVKASLRGEIKRFLECCRRSEFTGEEEQRRAWQPRAAKDEIHNRGSGRVASSRGAKNLGGGGEAIR